MRSTQEWGERGEDLAADYLEQRGFRILKRNYRFQRAEIDIVAEEHGELVFVEVKARRSDGFGEPEESVSKMKEERLRRAAEGFCIEHAMTERFYRFDIISIRWRGEVMRVKHLRNAL